MTTTGEKNSFRLFLIGRVCYTIVHNVDRMGLNMAFALNIGPDYRTFLVNLAKSYRFNTIYSFLSAQDRSTTYEYSRIIRDRTYLDDLKDDEKGLQRHY